MFDKLLEVGSAFDWITPVVAFFQDITHWPSHTFVIPPGSDLVGPGWTESDLRQLCRQRGIGMWGEMIVDGNTMFTVRKRHKAQVERLLELTKTRRPPRRSFLRRLF